MKKRNILIIIALLIVIISGVGVVYFMRFRPQEEEKPKQVVELESIAKYGYVLEDRDTELYKSVFTELRDILKDDVDYEKYAGAVAKLFIIDFYTVGNKMNKYDVGGLEFILPDGKDNYLKKAQDTVYKYVEDNSYGKRNQELPVVSKIDIVDLKKEEIAFQDEKKDGYSVDVKWEYEKDLGYDTKATIKIIPKDDKLFVVKTEGNVK